VAKIPNLNKERSEFSPATSYWHY